MSNTAGVPLTTLEAVLERITYANEETGYTIARDPTREIDRACTHCPLVLNKSFLRFMIIRRSHSKGHRCHSHNMFFRKRDDHRNMSTQQDATYENDPLKTILRRVSFASTVVSILWAIVGYSLLTGCNPVNQGQNIPGLTGRFDVQLGFIKSVAWSPDNTQLAVGASTPPLKIINTINGQTALELNGTNGTESIAWSPNGKYLAAASIAPSDTLHVWDLTAQKQSQPVLTADPSGGADSVAWSHDGGKLAVGVSGGSNTNGSVSNSAVVVYDTKGWSVLATLPYTSYVSSVTWSPDDKHIAFASSTVAFDNSLVVWDLDSGQQAQALHLFLNRQNVINSVAWSPISDHLVATSANDGTISIWDVAVRNKVATLSHGDNVEQVAWSPDGKRLASVSQNNTAKVWDSSSGALLKTFALTQFANAVAWSHDGKLLAVGCDDNAVWLWDVK